MIGKDLLIIQLSNDPLMDAAGSRLLSDWEYDDDNDDDEWLTLAPAGPGAPASPGRP